MVHRYKGARGEGQGNSSHCPPTLALSLHCRPASLATTSMHGALSASSSHPAGIAGGAGGELRVRGARIGVWLVRRADGEEGKVKELGRLRVLYTSS